MRGYSGAEGDEERQGDDNNQRYRAGTSRAVCLCISGLRKMVGCFSHVFVINGEQPCLMPVFEVSPDAPS